MKRFLAKELQQCSSDLRKIPAVPKVCLTWRKCPAPNHPTPCDSWLKNLLRLPKLSGSATPNSNTWMIPEKNTENRWYRGMRKSSLAGKFGEWRVCGFRSHPDVCAGCDSATHACIYGIVCFTALRPLGGAFAFQTSIVLGSSFLGSYQLYVFSNDALTRILLM